MSKRIDANNTCECCGALYGRRRFPGGKLEQMSQFIRRRFCGPQCRAIQTGRERTVPFWDRVDSSGGPDACWPWTGALNSSGYGNVGIGGLTLTASRVAYELTNGPLPEGDGYHGNVVRHSCDNPPCCNPAHLLPGTQADNNHDRDLRGRVKNRVEGERIAWSKLIERDVVEIRAMISAGDTDAAIAAVFGCSAANIYYIRNGRNWKCVPLIERAA